MSGTADPAPQVGGRVVRVCKHHGPTDFIRNGARLWRCGACSRERDRKRDRARGLWRRYRITEDDYDALLHRQGGCCAICRAPESSQFHRVLVVDHSHDTDEVRGLLCSNCNTALGLFKDDLGNLMRAQHYLIALP